MKIKKLTLKNFKSVVDETFVFNNGIICFSGNNGEGKSTVIHAILMLLFNAYDLSLRDYINWNASKFFISMSFEHMGEDYYEEFEYSEKTGSKRIFTKISTNESWENSAAVSKLAELIDPDLAKASIVSMENEQNLVTTTPAKRREYLKGVYNLEFKDQIDAISKDLENISQDEVYQQSRYSLLNSQIFEHKEYEEQVCSAEEYEQTKKQIDKLNGKKAELDAQDTRRDELKEKIADMNLSVRKSVAQMSSIDSKIESVQKDIDKISIDLDKEKSEDRLPELNEKLSSAKAEYESEVSKYQKEVEDIEKHIDEISSKPNLQNDIDEISNKVRNKSNEEHEAKILIEQSRKKIQILMTGVCPTCGHVVSKEETDAENKVLWDLEQRHAKLEVELDSLEKTERKLIDSQRDLDKELGSAKNSLSYSKSQLEMVRNKYERIIMNINHDIDMYETNKNNSIARYESELNNNKRIIESQKEMRTQVENLLSQYKDSIDKYTKDLDAIEDPLESLRELNREICDLKETVRKYEDVENRNKWITQYNMDIDEKAKKVHEEMAEIKSLLNGYAERKAMLEKAKTIVSREFPSFVISYMVKSLENYTNEFLLKVYPKYQIKITESKNSLAITYGPNNADVKMASGFEKSAFSLAYMYALGKMQKYGLLIVDEGDGAASDENSLLFYNTLAKSQEFFPQMFCITHKEVAKDLLQNTYDAKIYTAESGHYVKN